MMRVSSLIDHRHANPRPTTRVHPNLHRPTPPRPLPLKGGRGGVGLGWKLLGNAQTDKPGTGIPGRVTAADTQTQNWSLSKRRATSA